MLKTIPFAIASKMRQNANMTAKRIVNMNKAIVLAKAPLFTY